jgi:hypothetical protein
MASAKPSPVPVPSQTANPAENASDKAAPKTGRWIGGWPCHECKNKDPEWIVHFTDQPREGDQERECVYCHASAPVYRNKETVRLLRIKRSETAPCVQRHCQRCCSVQKMVNDGPMSNIPGMDWDIFECVACGKRHDGH